MSKRTPLLILTLALLAAAPGSAQKAARVARPAASVVVFAVERHQSNTTLEPVVIYRRGAFTKPPVEESDAAAKAFAGEYFKQGRKYRLLSGGGDAGTVTVQKYLDQGCVGLVAQADARTQVRLGGEVRALATDSPTVGRAPGSRRAPTDTERTLALVHAQMAFTSNGVPETVKARMDVINLTATDLERDGRFELVGSFKIEVNAGDAYTLFIIFEPDGEAIKPALTWFHHGGEGEYEDRRFVDQLDIDGDGVAEVIAAGHYYESNDYIIYKKRRGAWAGVYQGGGGGC